MNENILLTVIKPKTRQGKTILKKMIDCSMKQHDKHFVDGFEQVVKTVVNYVDAQNKRRK